MNELVAKEQRFSSPADFARWCENVLVLEKEAEDEETTELLKTCSQAELQSRGIAVLKLRVAEQSTALYGRACITLERISGDLPAHKISHGDIVGFFDQNSRPLANAHPLASAVVTRIKSSTIQVAFDGDVPIEVLDGRPLNIALVSSDVTLKRYREALDLLKSGSRTSPASRLVDVCFGEAHPRFYEKKTEDCARADAIDCTFLSESSQKLNEPQQSAVIKSLCAGDVAIIHGPPGTGKTTTLVSYILEAVYRKQRLLVTAPSNVAVDNLLERLADAGCRSLVRLGHPARVQESIHKFTMDNVVYGSEQAELCRDIKKEIDDIVKKNTSKSKKPSQGEKSWGALKELRTELRQRERRAVAEVLKHTQVVFATCTGAATLHRELRRSGVDSGGAVFDVVVIDEAAQALEVGCWIPLMLGKKAVLAGDHQQLSACVKSTSAQQQGLDETLFGRLIDTYGDEVAALLSIQYRSNEIIMGWSSRSFYESKLQAASSVAHQTLSLQEVPAANITPEILDILTAPMLFVDTGSLAMYREDGELSQSDLHQSRCNPGESRFVLHYAKVLVKAGLKPSAITVITPYNRQVEQLRCDFAEDPEAEQLQLSPRVSTVDSFQGQEADAVLISLVRSNQHGVVGFLSDFRRLNVAVTRARKHVMIVGDASTISKDNILSSLYEYACDSGRVAFVQQLLDEDGGVPADPATAQVIQEERLRAMAQKAGAMKEKRDDKMEREEQLRRRFENQLRPLTESGKATSKEEKSFIELPKTLNPFERAMAHEVAKSLGLQHESIGEGMQRRLVVWKGEKPELLKQTEAAPHVTEEMETAIDAFERRAKSLMSSLGPGKAAEWKNPSEEEAELLKRLAGELKLRVVEDESKKSRRFQVQAPSAEAAPTAESQKISSNKENQPAPAAAPAASSMLANLHAERLQRQQAQADKRATELQKTQNELKQAKKAAKKEKGAKPQADDDDLDAVLLEFTTQERTCSFASCKEKINTLMDAISKCRYCNLRFCLNHAQAEVHGCGEQAHRAEQKKWKDTCNAASSRGSGLVNKSAGKDGRGALVNKLQEKVKEQEAGRTAKKKDKK
ncbi:unnamed protein product [Durusdinium trenchii]|uniref:DNA-binding protein SMUBP-2 (ATP-dependent helicase IGHMBP2) (Glial factor 1) (GF-1) (Immunoglobulin mu-binding protein 2) n=2 Tax=Durusdinium trenchii TaxID=1381693 RepID=A0ABP0MH13_9DINO